jgi:hypothetical protein
MPLTPESTLVSHRGGTADLRPVDVRNAVGRADEVHGAAVGRERRVGVASLIEARQRADLPALDVHDRDAVVAEGEGVEVGREAVGREGDLPAVGRPDRLQIAVRVAGERRAHLRLEVEHVQVEQPAGERGKDDAAPVRRPRGREDLPQLGELVLGLAASRARVDDGQHRLPAAERGEGEPPVVGRPVAGRTQELQAVEVRVAGRAYQPALDAAGLDVGEIHVDREERPLGEEHDLPAVAADGRRQVQAAAGTVLADDRPRDALHRFGRLDHGL